jgi:hypothetical protein
MITYSLVLCPKESTSPLLISTYLRSGIASPLTFVPFALSRSITYGLTFPIRSPNSLTFSTCRNCKTACCLLQDGCSMGKSTTAISRPNSQQLRWASSTVVNGSVFDPLNSYIRQACDAAGLRASVGSWYLSTMSVPATRFASAASLPEIE